MLVCWCFDVDKRRLFCVPVFLTCVGVCVCYMVKAPLSPQKGPTNCGVAEDFDPEAELVCERRRRMKRKGEAK